MISSDIDIPDLASQ